MKAILSTLLLLPSLALSLPILSPRQTFPIQISSIALSGDGCPDGTYSTTVSPDGTVVTFGFNSYDVAVGAGASSSDREKYCDIFLTLQFPLGCTAAEIDATYHGFADLTGGATGVETDSYSLSPGVAAGSNPGPALFPAGTFDTYSKSDVLVVSERINGANQQSVSFVARTRVFVQAQNDTSSGTISVDDATFAITKQTQACS